MKRLEVRCCCQPRKLLGWIEVNDENAPFVRLQLMNKHEVNLNAADVTQTMEFLTLPIRTCGLGPHSWRAICSEETPIEKLRMVRGFQERRA